MHIIYTTIFKRKKKANLRNDKWTYTFASGARKATQKGRRLKIGVQRTKTTQLLSK